MSVEKTRAPISNPIATPAVPADRPPAGTGGEPSGPRTAFLKGGAPVAPRVGAPLARGVFGSGIDPVMDTPAPGIRREGAFDRIAENLEIENNQAPLSMHARDVLETALLTA